jgi:hypothetical protein
MRKLAKRASRGILNMGEEPMSTSEKVMSMSVKPMNMSGKLKGVDE